jgi:acetylornithine deacetylase/succinyl-diaminopimelate desuccinylase-like protein
MTDRIHALRQIFKDRSKDVFNDFFTFLRFPSISSEPSHKPQVTACCEWLSNYLKEMGFNVEIWSTPGHPTIFAKHLGAGPTKPTLLIYNHYDVQPIDPLNEWHSQPFEPSIRNGQIFARGAQDNKGQCFYTVQALKAMLDINKKFPINIKLCIEGEEECGSDGLSKIIPKYAKELKADYLAVVDLGIPASKRPSITLGLRGLITMDVDVQGTNGDLHSGSHGGIAYNPIHALTSLLASLRDASGKITVPGFYDDVQLVSAEEKKLLSLDFNEAAYIKTFGAKATGGEKDFPPQERAWLRPTLEINGISGGYAGAGFKTVIPAKAHAKISCRLAPNQDPQRTGKLVADFLEKNAPDGVTVKVHVHPGCGKALRTKATSTVAKAFAQAYSEVFEKPCEYIFEGASIPIVPQLAAASESEVVLVGLGLPDDCIHAPNEHFGVDRFEQGFLSIIRAIEILGEK